MTGKRVRFSYGEADGPRQIIEATLDGDPEVTLDDVGFYPSGIPIRAIRMWQRVTDVVIDGEPLPDAPSAAVRLDCVHDQEEIA